MRIMYYKDNCGNAILSPKEFLIVAFTKHYIERLYYKEVFSYPQQMLVTFFTEEDVPYASVIADYKELEQCSNFITKKEE